MRYALYPDNTGTKGRSHGVLMLQQSPGADHGRSVRGTLVHQRGRHTNRYVCEDLFMCFALC